MFTEIKTLVKNFISLIAGYFFVRLFSFVATLYLTKALGPTVYGPLSFGIAIALVFSVAANFGLEKYTTREIALDGEVAGSLLGDSLALKTVLMPLAFAIGFGLGRQGSGHSWLYLILLAYGLLHSHLLLVCAVFQGLEKMHYQSYLLTAQMLMMAVGAILAVWLTQDVLVVAYIYCAVTLLILAAGYVLLVREGVRPQFRWQPGRWAQLLRTALPFGINFIGLLVYDRLAIILIAMLEGDTAVGLFSSVHNAILVLTTLPTVIITAVFPLLTRKAQHKLQDASVINQNLLKYTGLIGLGISAALYLAAPVVVPAVLGPAYQPAVPILRVLALSIPFLFLSIVMLGILEAAGQQRASAKTIGTLFPIALPLALFMTWWGGYHAATIIYVVNHMLLALVLLRLVHRRVTPLSAKALLPLGHGGLQQLRRILRQAPTFMKEVS